jgi:hypothetical protein
MTEEHANFRRWPLLRVLRPSRSALIQSRISNLAAQHSYEVTGLAYHRGGFPEHAQRIAR